MLNVECWLFFFFVLCGTTFGATNDTLASDDSGVPPPAVADANARELYNLGTQQLRARKLSEAERLLQSSIAKQEGPVQPMALFNLGFTRFTQGSEILKKSPAGTAQRNRAAMEAGGDAIQNVEAALASQDVQQMLQAYFAGRGTHKEMRQALKAVQLAMTAYGETLTKWRRALSDFQSAAELNPTDTNAVQNAEIVEAAIAKLVDSLREMQSAAVMLGQKKDQLGELLKQLKGQIPAANMPPGAPGDDGDDDEGGEKPMPDSLRGQEEAENGGGGQEMDLKISPAEAGQLLNGIQPDGKLLPMESGAAGKPKDHSGRNW